MLCKNNISKKLFVILFTVESAIEFLNEIIKIPKNKKKRLRAEIILTTRTTPNNLFIAVCNYRTRSLSY
jgi:hypothetical protein